MDVRESWKVTVPVYWRSTPQTLAHIPAPNGHPSITQLQLGSSTSSTTSLRRRNQGLRGETREHGRTDQCQVSQLKGLRQRNSMALRAAADPLPGNRATAGNALVEWPLRRRGISRQRARRREGSAQTRGMCESDRPKHAGCARATAPNTRDVREGSGRQNAPPPGIPGGGAFVRIGEDRRYLRNTCTTEGRGALAAPAAGIAPAGT